jgi:hypothetical protein
LLEPSSGIHVETSPSFDRCWYRTQTALQVLLGVLILAGLAGVFGGGWLSAFVVHVGPFEVTYDRFARKSVPFRISIEGKPVVRPVRITIGRDLIEKVGVIRTIPAALSAADTADGTELVFGAPQAPSRIAIEVRPNGAGIFRWTLKVEGAGEASLFQIIYP